MPQLFDYITLPPENNFIDSLAIARIKTAARKGASGAFIEFMRTDAAAAI
jgi:hypothetical protein